MRKTVCYPVSSIDKKIAQDERFKSAGYVPAMIANLRALYDSSHAFEFAPDTMDDETIIAEKLDTLYEYYKNLRDKDRSQISNTGNMYADAFLSLIQANLLSEQRKIAADIIASVLKDFEKECGKDVTNNADYYSFLVHLCQKKVYEIDKTLEKPDTFLEDVICKSFKESPDAFKKYKYITFEMEFTKETIKINENEIAEIKFLV